MLQIYRVITNLGIFRGVSHLGSTSNSCELLIVDFHFFLNLFLVHNF